MLALERRKEILKKLQEEKKVIVGELSRQYDVSEETIRRDLEKLEKEGLAVKSYGGAVLNDSTSIELPFNERKKHNVEGKQKIAKLVADLVENGEHIMLDASSTAVFIAKAMKKKEQLTVLTNSIEVLLELADTEGWEVISTGGVLKDRYLALVGAKATEAVQQYHVEKTIISCRALDGDKGFSESNVEFAQMKQAMMKAGRQVILAADSSKLYRFAFAKVGDLKDIDILVTDEKPDARMQRLLDAAQVTCLYPE